MGHDATKGPTKGKHQAEPLSSTCIGACMDQRMGIHCAEVDYQRSLGIVLAMRGLEFQREVEVPVTCEGVTVTKRPFDFLISDGQDELLL